MLENYNTYYSSGTKEEITRETLSLAFSTAIKEKIRNVLIPSTTGFSANIAFLEVPDEITLVVVTHSHGYINNGESEFPKTLRDNLIASRHKLLTATHAFKGLEGYLQKKYGGISLSQAFADGLRLVSPGLKVLIEISVMACDGGILSVNDWIVSCGGPHRGLDTAAIIRPTTSHHMQLLRFARLICFPDKYVGGENNA